MQSNEHSKNKSPADSRSGENTDRKSAGTNKEKKRFSFNNLKEHKNPVIRITMQIIYSVWLGVMAIGVFFAWLISVLLL